MRIYRNQLYPFERAILAELGAALPPGVKESYSAQLRCINKVQRLLDWNEIEFYCMRFFRVRWPEQYLFLNKDEFILGTGEIGGDSLTADIAVWAVGGHVFSIESESPLKRFRSLSSVEFRLQQCREAR